MLLDRLDGQMQLHRDLRMAQPFLFVKPVDPLLLLRELRHRFIQQRMIILVGGHLRRRHPMGRRHKTRQTSQSGPFPGHIPNIIEDMIPRRGKKVGVKVPDLRQSRAFYPDLDEDILNDFLGGLSGSSQPEHISPQPLMVGPKQLGKSRFIPFRDAAQQQSFLVWWQDNHATKL